MDAWRDGIAAMLRASQRGIAYALEPEEESVVRSLVLTILIAKYQRPSSGR